MWNYAQLSETDFGKSLLIKQVTSVEEDTDRGVADLTSHLAVTPSLAGLYTGSSGSKVSGNKLWDGHAINGSDEQVFFFQSGFQTTAASAKSLQSCPTLCDPIDSSPRGSPIPGILQARTLEWVAISFSIAGKWKVRVKSLSRVRFLATPWTAAHQAPSSVGFSRQEYWSGLPLPSPFKPLGAC